LFRLEKNGSTILQYIRFPAAVDLPTASSVGLMLLLILATSQTIRTHQLQDTCLLYMSDHPTKHAFVGSLVICYFCHSTFQTTQTSKKQKKLSPL